VINIKLLTRCDLHSIRLDFPLDTKYLFCHLWANLGKVYTLKGPQTSGGLQGECHERLSVAGIGGVPGANADMFTSVGSDGHQNCRR
jgi:hypothetical protein